MAYDQFKNVFVSDSGDLIDKRTLATVREKYSFTFSRIRNTKELRATIRNGKYSQFGGYPLFLYASDGDTLCFDCVEKDYKSLAHDYNGNTAIVGCEINYEDQHMYCAHCNKQIESAYGDDGQPLEGDE